MKRRALIIGSPDEKIPGVIEDVRHFKTFLTSGVGGAWATSEIVVLENPSEAVARREIEALKAVDYSLTIFAGHGSHPERRGSTKVQLNSSATMDVDDLKIGARKHTLIVDCCRLLGPTLVMEALTAKLAKRSAVDPARCRAIYDAHIATCGPGLVTMYGCSINETASESEDGGFYSSALIDTARDWSEGSFLRVANGSVLSVVEVHDRAREAVQRRSGNRQNPTAEYPRSNSPHFPFAVAG